MRKLVAPPFRPGAGRVPPVLAGRDQLLDAFDRMLADITATSEGDRPWVLSGLRGVGKTALLNEFVRRAKRLGWTTVKVEAAPNRSLALALANALYRPLRDSAPQSEKAAKLFQRALRVFSSFQLHVDPSGAATFGFDVEPERGVADSGVLSADLFDLLQALGAAMRAAHSGVLLAVDELQDAPTVDTQSLNIALHELGQEASPVPVFFVGTGLPSLPAVLADATSYAERLYVFRTLGLLDDEATRDALVRPVAELGVSWDKLALSHVLAVAKGYPYFVQTCGKHVWEALSEEDSTISVDVADKGIVQAKNEVDEGLYRSRFERATPLQREFMAAMAEDHDEPSSINALTGRLGRKRASDISIPRRDLIRGGHIYAPERGFLAFTVPGMADFINGQTNLENTTSS